MKERELKFNRNENPTLVVDADGKILKNLTDIYSKLQLNLGFCRDQLKEGCLTEGMKEMHLSLTEAYVLEFLEALKYDGVLERQKQERFSEIRELNEQNRDLRKQLSEKLTNEDAREKIKNMSKIFRVWWNIYGFGYASDIQFGAYGTLDVKLSGMISEAYYNKENPSLTEEDKVEYLVGLGFEIDGEKYVKGSEKNIELLRKLITDKFPSANIIETAIYSGRKQNKIKEVKVCITNLDDLI